MTWQKIGDGWRAKSGSVYLGRLSTKWIFTFYFARGKLYVYATLFPKIYSRIDSEGVKEKISFKYKYHNWWNRKYNSHHYQQSQIQCANDLLDGSVEEVHLRLAKDPASVVPTNPNEQQVIDNEKLAVLKKTVLSKPKTPKENFT